MNINHISVSRKQVWDTCQQRYKYQYHLRLETNQEEPWHFTYGSIIHKIAQEYVGHKGEKLISEVANEVLNGVIPYEDNKKAPPLPAEYKRKLPEHLRALQQFTEKTGWDGELEYNFKFDINPPHGKYVFGYIDRLILKEDRAWIIDYKTTKLGPWRKSSKDIATDLQLRVYARVAQKTFGLKAENIKCALYYLEGPEVVGAFFSQASLDSVERELLHTYNAIKNTPPEAARGNVGPHCNFCDYKAICPFFRGADDVDKIIKG